MLPMTSSFAPAAQAPAAHDSASKSPVFRRLTWSRNASVSSRSETVSQRRGEHVRKPQLFAAVDEALNHKQAHQVGFGLLDGAVCLTQLLTDRRLASVLLNDLRPQAVAQLVGQDEASSAASCPRRSASRK